MSPSGKAPDFDSGIRRFKSGHPSQKKARSKERAFFCDVCLRQMMTATPNDVRFANDVCLTAHWANITSLRNEVEQHHFERRKKHHIAVGDASLKIQGSRLDLLAEVWYNDKKGGLI